MKWVHTNAAGLRAEQRDVYLKSVANVWPASQAMTPFGSRSKER